MDVFVERMIELSIEAAKRGDREATKELLALAVQAQEAHRKEITAIFEQIERINLMVEQATSQVFGSRKGNV